MRNDQGALARTLTDALARVPLARTHHPKQAAEPARHASLSDTWVQQYGFIPEDNPTDTILLDFTQELACIKVGYLFDDMTSDRVCMCHQFRSSMDWFDGRR